MDNNNQQSASDIEERLKREQILRILEIGSKSKHWKMIAEKIDSWIKKEQSFLDNYRQTGISDKDLKNYNRVVDQIFFMKKFLQINDILISENKTIIEKLKDKVQEYKGVAKSFFELKS